MNKSADLMRSAAGKTGSHTVQQLLAIKTLGGRATLDPGALHSLACRAIELITQLDKAAAKIETP